MFIKKIARGSNFAGTVMISLLASAASGHSQGVNNKSSYRPIQSIRYDFGSKSTTGYFVQQGAKCLVRLMVYDKRDLDSDAPSSAMRVRLVLSPGQTSGLDSDEGRSLNFTCGEGATALLVDLGEREPLVELQTLSLRKTARE